MSVPYSVHMVDWDQLNAKLAQDDSDGFQEWLSEQSCDNESQLDREADHFQDFVDYYQACQEQAPRPWMEAFEQALDIVCAHERDSGKPMTEGSLESCNEYVQYAWSPATVSRLNEQWNAAHLEDFESLPVDAWPKEFCEGFYSDWKTILQRAAAQGSGLVVCVWS